MAAFVTRLQPRWLPIQAARQLPEQSTTLRVAPTATGHTRIQGAHSFDHLVGAGEYRGRHFEAERLSGLEIDNQLDLRGLIDWQVGRLRTLENAAGVEADVAV